MAVEEHIKKLWDIAGTDLFQLYDAVHSPTVSDYRQQKDGWCGPAALSYAMAQQGLKVPQNILARLTKTTVKSGVDPKYLVDEARRFGFNTETYSGEDPNATLEKLDQALLDNKSIILDYLEGDDVNNDGHYVVYQGSTGNKVIFWDPSKARNIVLDRDKFIAQWKDKTIGGKIFKDWALVLSQPI